MESFFNLENKQSEKWLWIELIGFNNSEADYGVDKYINNLGFMPNGISLLLYSIDFVNMHEGLNEEKKLSPCHCSYLAHPYNEDRARQEWTNFQLKNLIREIKSHGIKVFLSFFNMFSYSDDNGNFVMEEYCKEHMELWDCTRDGTRTYVINMLKRLSSGRFYEDYFTDKIKECLRDYEFDGLQVADGISSARKSLQESDYSDDMVDQFTACSNQQLPFNTKLDNDSVKFQERASYIWENLRLEWIEFHITRWQKFLIKLFAGVHEAGCEVLFHSAWTRDPFEAIYRYGMDYQKAVEAGADMLLVNEVSSGISVSSQEDNFYLLEDAYRKKLHYEYTSMLMLIKAFSKSKKILTLSGIKDTAEDYDVIHHAPTAMQRDVYTNLNTLIIKKDKIEPCITGPLFCLSDGLKAHEWDFIKKTWETGYTATPYHTGGITLVWSDKRMYNELDYFIKTRGWHTHKLVYELQYSGMPVNCIVRMEDLESAKGPLMITNPGLMPKDELEKIKVYNGGLLIYIGQPESQKSYVYQNSKAVFSIYSPQEGKELIRHESPYIAGMLGTDHRKILDKVGGLWTCPLSYAELDSRFLDYCVKESYQATGLPRVIKREKSCKPIAVKLSPDKYRILVGNDDYYYNRPVIDMGRKIKNVSVISKYYGYEATLDGTTVCLKVPGRGMDIVDVTIETENDCG